MIYVDTVTGKLVIDTEAEAMTATIMIMRDRAGIHIQYKKPDGVQKDGLRQRLWQRAKTGVPLPGSLGDHGLKVP